MKKHYIMLFVVAVLLGSTYPLLKIAVLELSPFSLVAYRFLLAAIVMLVFIKFFKLKVFQKKEMLYGLSLGVILSGVYSAEVIGIQWTNASNAGFISDLTVVFVVIFGFLFFKQKIRLNVLLGVFIVFIGLYFLIFTQGLMFYKGDFIVLMSPILASLHVLITSKIADKVNINIILFYQFVSVFLISFALSFMFGGGNILPTNLNIIFIIIYLGVIVTVFRYFSEIYSMRNTDPIKVVLIFLMTPVWAVVFSYLFLQEVLLFWQYVGCLLILSGLALIQALNKNR